MTMISDDAVERAAREYVRGRHPEWHDRGVGIAQGSHYRSGFVAGAVWQHQQDAALAAAGAGEAVDPDVKAVMDQAERDARALGFDWHAGEAVDREALDEDDDPAVEVVAEAFHHPKCNHHTGGPAECDSRAMTAVMALRRAGFLSARGDAAPDPEPWEESRQAWDAARLRFPDSHPDVKFAAISRCAYVEGWVARGGAAPTVTAEQVEAAARAGSAEWLGDTPSAFHSECTTDALRAAGIEVTP